MTIESTVMTRRDALKKIGAIGVGIALLPELFLAACAQAVEPPLAATKYKFAENTPTAPRILESKPFHIAPVLAIYGQFLTEPTRRLLTSLDDLITDPTVRYNTASGIISNALASRPDGSISRAQILKEKGRTLFFNFCADSRLVCSDLTAVANGQTYTVVESRSLGAQPKVPEKGTTVSLLATHCDSSGVLTGCGALNAVERMKELGGEAYLKNHNILDSTIQQIKSGLSSSNPEIQAVTSAKHQALVTYLANNDENIVVAAVYGQADNSWKILGAYNQFGEEVKVPPLVEDFIARNSGKAVGDINEALLKQKPPIYALNATGINTQTLLGPTAAEPGNMFKITALPDNGTRRAINVAEVDFAVAGNAYAQANKWGQLQWVVARSPEELDLLRSRLLANKTTWTFLENKGVIVEALVDTNGAFTGSLRVSSIGELGSLKSEFLASQQLGLVTSKISLSAKTFAEAEKALAEGLAQDVPKATKIIRGLKATGKLFLTVLDRLQPIFLLLTLDDLVSEYKKSHGYEKVYYEHAKRLGIQGPVTKSLPESGYALAQTLYPAVEPYLVYSKMYDTTQHPYTRSELANEFSGMVKDFISDMGIYNSRIITKERYTIKDPNSKYAGQSLDSLYKILKLDFIDKHDHGTQKVLTKVGRPLVYFPVPPENYQSNNPWLEKADLQKEQFIILDPDTGEFLLTGVEGQMVVPMVIENQKSGMAKTVYYIHIHMDKNGNMVTKNVGFDDPTKKTMMNGKEWIVVSDQGDPYNKAPEVNLPQRLPSSEVMA